MASRWWLRRSGAGRFFKVFENFVFYPPVQKAKALLDEGAIGEPLTIRIKSVFGDPRHGWPIPGSAQAWRLDPARCGGGPIVFDDGHHKFALAWWFMGMPEEVHAWIGRTAVAGGMVDGPAMISFRFPGSRLGVFEAVHARDLLIDTRHYAQDDQIEITGSKGVLWVTRGHGQAGRPPARDPLPRRRDQGLLGHADRLGGEFRALDAGYDRGVAGGTAAGADRRAGAGGAAVLAGGAPFRRGGPRGQARRDRRLRIWGRAEPLARRAAGAS